MARRGTFRNFKRTARRMEVFGAAFGLRAGSGLRQIGEEIMTDAKATSPGRGVPVKTGALRDSGHVEQLPNLDVVLSFGDSAATYALIQHEAFSFHHVTGEPRYLVRAVYRWKPNGSAAIEGLRLQVKAAAAIARAAG